MLGEYRATVKVVGLVAHTTTIDRQLAAMRGSKFASLFHPSVTVGTTQAIWMKMLQNPLPTFISIEQIAQGKFHSKLDITSPAHILHMSHNKNRQVNEQQEYLESLEKDKELLENQLQQLALMRGEEISQTEHVSCFFAMPFNEKYDPFLEAVRRVLEDKPYGWQVIRADDQQLPNARTISDNIKKHIARSDCYLAEISDSSPNVYLEIGLMSQYRERPQIYLYRRDAEEKIAADLSGYLYLAYERWNPGNLDDPNEPINADINALVRELREAFATRRDLRQLRSNGKKTYLSPTVLLMQRDRFREQEAFPRALVENICNHYETVEDFVETDSTVIASRIDAQYARGSIEDIQSFLRTHFGLS